MFIQIWRNSIGDYATPRYPAWTADFEGERIKFFQKLYIYLIWMTWVANQLIIQVILLNFLIAIVNNSYSRETKIQKVNEFIHMAAVNSEVALFYKSMKGLRQALLCERNRHQVAERHNQGTFNMVVIFKAIHDTDQLRKEDENNSDLQVIEDFIKALTE